MSRLALAVLGILLTVACSRPATQAQTTPIPVLGEARSPRQATIVQPPVAPGVFPRTVHDSSGDVIIQRKPMHIHTLSVGLDEITFELVDPSRIAAVGTVTANADYSNVADQAAKIPLKVGRDAEQILGAGPDLVVASPFTDVNLIAQLRNANVTVVVPDLVSSADGQADNVRFLAYLYGEEAHGETLVKAIDARIARLNAATARHSSEQRPRALVLTGGQNLTTAGSGTTEDGVLTLAGLRNAAAEAGVSGNAPISLETIPEMQPDVVVVTEPNPAQPMLLPRLRDMPVIGDLPALRDNKVVIVKSSLMTTLSHWNLSGAEQLNRAVYPGELR